MKHWWVSFGSDHRLRCLEEACPALHVNPRDPTLQWAAVRAYGHASPEGLMFFTPLVMRVCLWSPLVSGGGTAGTAVA